VSLPHVRRAGRARRAALVRGVGALLLLALLVVGPPAGLLAYVGNPWPEQLVVGGQFTDSAVIGLLAVVVWVAWAQLILAVMVEAVAAIRGSGIPQRLPLTGPQQRMARRLVGAVLLLSSAAAALNATPSIAYAGTATAAAAHNALSATAAERPSGPAPAGTAALAAEASATPRDHGVDAAEGADGKVHVVRKADTLWDIAEAYLGDGLRWREIYELNKHRPQPDGHRLELARLIMPGWVLRLPADAATDMGTPSPTPEGEANAVPGETYTVQPGDRMSDIAERRLGAADRYHEIYQLNDGRPQPVGGRLTDPDVIRPGWVLRLPPPAAKAAPPEVGTARTGSDDGARHRETARPQPGRHPRASTRHDRRPGPRVSVCRTGPT